MGGQLYESAEENPMIGYRGACRRPSHEFHDGLVLECNAIKKVREEIGLNNVHLMIHFVRMV